MRQPSDVDRLSSGALAPPRTLEDRCRTHWLTIVNALAAVFVALPLLAPMLLVAGLSGPANLIYAAYRGVCHQWAFRSYFLFGPRSTYSLEELSHLACPNCAFSFVGAPELGYKVAFCERDLAIYLAVLVAGLAYAALRPRPRPLGLAAYLLVLAPIALDGFSQLFGLRESTPLLRTLTGGLFGLGSVWFVYPRIDRAVGYTSSACRDECHETSMARLGHVLCHPERAQDDRETQADTESRDDGGRRTVRSGIVDVGTR